MMLVQHGENRAERADKRRHKSLLVVSNLENHKWLNERAILAPKNATDDDKGMFFHPKSYSP